MNKLNWLDRTLLFVAPKFTADRLAWQKFVKSSYDSGNASRLNAAWTPVNSSAEITNQGERDRIRARARDLERNSDIEEAIINAFERNVIGTGFKLQAKTESADLNLQIQNLINQWSKAKNCDISERFSLLEMQNMAMRRIKVDGGLLFIKSYQSEGILPFCLQMREVDDIDSTMFSTSYNGNKIINGVEVNEYNKSIAYWIKQTSPDGYFNQASVRIEAKNVIYLNRLKRPSQIREISELATTASRIRDINEFVNAVSIKERILACLTAWIKKINPGSGGIGRPTNIPIANDNSTISSSADKNVIGPGVINELAPGEDVIITTPNGQATNAKEFIMFQQRLAGAGQGISYESISRDYSQTNYSSARQGLLEDWGTYKVWQLILIEKFLDEIYEEFITSAVLSGKLNIKITDYLKNKEKYLAHKWIPSGWSWIDPLKEANANKVALETGQTTLEEIHAGQGRDWKEVLAQRAKEKTEMKSLGLEDTTSTNTKGNSTNAKNSNTTAS